MTAKFSYTSTKKDNNSTVSLFCYLEYMDFFRATKIQADFSALASRFQTIFLQGVPRFGGKEGSQLVVEARWNEIEA